MNLKALAAEFIGTFALIFVGMLVGHHLGSTPGGLLGIALGHGLAIAILGSATGGISGGHLNPAVSFALFITGRISAATFGAYAVAQLAGAFVAAVVAGFLIGDAAFVGDQVPSVAATVGSASFSSIQAVVAEAVATFFLVFAVFGTAVDPRGPRVGALYIGLAVTIGILAIGPLTGGALNPARWFGPALASMHFANFWVYIVGPCAGAALAAYTYTWFLNSDSVTE